MPKALPLATRAALALAYASGEKVAGIAAQWRVTSTAVTQAARSFGAPLRAHRLAAQPPATESLAVVAAAVRRRALTLETDARVLRALAQRSIRPTTSAHV